MISQPSANCKHFFTIFEKIFFARVCCANAGKQTQNIAGAPARRRGDYQSPAAITRKRLAFSVILSGGEAGVEGS